MKKVTIYGTGNIGSRLAYFLAHSRDISRIRLVDSNPERTRSTVLDFLEANIALKSKIMVVNADEPIELELSDVVVIATSTDAGIKAGINQLSEKDVRQLEDISAHIGHFAPQAWVAVISQPAELICSELTSKGFVDRNRVLGFPLLIYREWYREQIARVVGLTREDVRITTVRTLEGVELVPEQCAVGGVPLLSLIDDPAELPSAPDIASMAHRISGAQYSPAAVAAGVVGELVSKRRQVITSIVPAGENKSFVETKAIVGPERFEREIEMKLSDDQAKGHAAYRAEVLKASS